MRVPGDPIGGSLGNGMWKSTDAGSTWQHIGLEDTVKIDSILVDPADPNLVIVSALGDATHQGGGVYRSTDGGQTWTNVLKPAGYDGTRDLQFAYDDPGVMLAATQGTGGAASGCRRPRRAGQGQAGAGLQIHRRRQDLDPDQDSAFRRPRCPGGRHAHQRPAHLHRRQQH